MDSAYSDLPVGARMTKFHEELNILRFFERSEQKLRILMHLHEKMGDLMHIDVALRAT
jgi:hypothetical protein